MLSSIFIAFFKNRYPGLSKYVFPKVHSRGISTTQSMILIFCFFLAQCIYDFIAQQSGHCQNQTFPRNRFTTLSFNFTTMCEIFGSIYTATAIKLILDFNAFLCPPRFLAKILLSQNPIYAPVWKARLTKISPITENVHDGTGFSFRNHYNRAIRKLLCHRLSVF